MSDEKEPIPTLAVRLKALSTVIAWARASVIPVIAAVLATQAGAGIFMQGHVDNALLKIIAPATRQTGALHDSVRAAYKELATVTNEHAKQIHGKADRQAFERLVSVVETQRAALEDAQILLTALKKRMTEEHGRESLEETLHETVKVHTLSELQDTPPPVAMPLVPDDFETFSKKQDKK